LRGGEKLIPAAALLSQKILSRIIYAKRCVLLTPRLLFEITLFRDNPFYFEFEIEEASKALVYTFAPQKHIERSLLGANAPPNPPLKSAGNAADFLSPRCGLPGRLRRLLPPEEMKLTSHRVRAFFAAGSARRETSRRCFSPSPT
jgi:hypothetical protein